MSFKGFNEFNPTVCSAQSFQVAPQVSEVKFVFVVLSHTENQKFPPNIAVEVKVSQLLPLAQHFAKLRVTFDYFQ